MKELTYTCRFCQTTRSFEADPAGLVALKIDVELWLKHLCCNRCSAYHVGKQRLGQKITRACYVLMMARKNQPEERNKIEAGVRSALERLTQKFCSHVCDYYMKSDVNDPQFVEILMDQPDMVSKHLNFYARSIATIQ